jgi:hypothetical protein
MFYMTKSTIATFLQHESNTLGQLLNKLNQLKRWNGWLSDCLSGELLLTKHCKIVKLDGTSLIVIADNPHWVTRFRFFIPSLLTKLQKYPDLQNIRSICCKVRPPHQHLSNIHRARRRPLKVSANTAEILQETANKIKNEKLQKILLKMASRVEQENE